MEINSKNCFTCKYYETSIQYNERMTRCSLGEFDITDAEKWVCDRYEGDKDAMEEFLKRNFKKINNFRLVNKTNDNVIFGNAVFKK